MTPTVVTRAEWLNARKTLLEKEKELTRLAPSAIVALLPKCPACLAAYLALGTGIGVSVTAAAWLQSTAIAVCLGSLLVLVSRIAVRRRR